MTIKGSTIGDWRCPVKGIDGEWQMCYHNAAPRTGIVDALGSDAAGKGERMTEKSA